MPHFNRCSPSLEDLRLFSGVVQQFSSKALQADLRLLANFIGLGNRGGLSEKELTKRVSEVRHRLRLSCCGEFFAHRAPMSFQIIFLSAHSHTTGFRSYPAADGRGAVARSAAVCPVV